MKTVDAIAVGQGKVAYARPLWEQCRQARDGMRRMSHVIQQLA